MSPDNGGRVFAQFVKVVAGKRRGCADDISTETNRRRHLQIFQTAKRGRAGDPQGEKLGLTQAQFAARFAFSINTLRHCKQRKRQPEGRNSGVPSSLGLLTRPVSRGLSREGASSTETSAAHLAMGYRTIGAIFIFKRIYLYSGITARTRSKVDSRLCIQYPPGGVRLPISGQRDMAFFMTDRVSSATVDERVSKFDRILA
jgi:hypothetical protein